MSIFSKKKVFTADEQYAMNVKQQMKFDHKMVGALIGLMMDLSKTGRTVYLHDDTGAIVMNRRFAQKNNLKFAEGVDFYTVIKESELKELRDIKEKYMRMELENKIRKEVGASAVVQNQITQEDVPKKEDSDPNSAKLEKSDMNDGLDDDNEVKEDHIEKTDPVIDKHEQETESQVLEAPSKENAGEVVSATNENESQEPDLKPESPGFKARGNKDWRAIRKINEAKEKKIARMAKAGQDFMNEVNSKNSNKEDY